MDGTMKSTTSFKIEKFDLGWNGQIMNVMKRTKLGDLLNKYERRIIDWAWRRLLIDFPQLMELPYTYCNAEDNDEGISNDYEITEKKEKN